MNKQLKQTKTKHFKIKARSKYKTAIKLKTKLQKL